MRLMSHERLEVYQKSHKARNSSSQSSQCFPNFVNAKDSDHDHDKGNV